MDPYTIPTRFLGCDVGKTTIVVYDSLSRRTLTIANRAADLATFLAGCEPTAFLVCEATGGYEDALLAAALGAGVPAHRADARKVKAFIRSFGILGKTDAIDAKALVTYAQERHASLPRWQLADPGRDTLQALVLTRRDLVAQRVAFANRRGAPGAEVVAPFLDPVIACLEAQVKAIDAAIAALVRADDRLCRDTHVLCTIPGIAARTATSLLALMPELGQLDRRKIAALAGLAPHPNQSGSRDGARRVKGGRPHIRHLLFMPCLAAVRSNQALRQAYNRLIANGKKPLVAIVAIMRKLVVIANAKLRDANLRPAIN